MNTSPQLFANILPDVVCHIEGMTGIVWKIGHRKGADVLETEYLHLCHLVEKTLDATQRVRYCNQIGHFSDWAKRLTAIAQVKGLARPLTGNDALDAAAAAAWRERNG